jgi:hypothetical protein
MGDVKLKGFSAGGYTAHIQATMSTKESAQTYEGTVVRKATEISTHLQR